MALRERIYELLQKETLNDQQLEERLNYPRASIRRARQELMKQGLVEQATKTGRKFAEWRAAAAAAGKKTAEMGVETQGQKTAEMAQPPKPSRKPTGGGLFSF